MIFLAARAENTIGRYQRGHTVKIHKTGGTTTILHFKLEDGAVLLAPDVREQRAAGGYRQLLVDCDGDKLFPVSPAVVIAHDKYPAGVQVETTDTADNKGLVA